MMDTEIVGQDRKDLAELSVEAWDAILDSQSPHTRRAYRVQWGAFTRWARSLNHEPLPAAPSTVANYLAARVLGGMAVSSARLAASAIRAAHEAAGYPNPCATDAVRRTLSGLGRIHGRPQAQAAPLDNEALGAIRATAHLPRGRETAAAARRRGLVDMALCAVLSDAGLRRSEVSALTWGEIMNTPDRSGRVHVVRSKTDPEAEGAVVAVTAATMRALDAIRPALPNDEARVFPLSESQVSRRVAAAAAVAGLGRGYSGHSGRVGLALKMAKAGAPANVAQRQGRWRSADTLARYTRRLAAGEALRYL